MATINCRSYTVKPAEPTPHVTLWLPECDQVRPFTHAPAIYFYRPISNAAAAKGFEAMKSTLSEALVHFYPLAGRLRWNDHGRLDLHCNEMGVQLIEADSDASMDDYGDFRPTPELRKLIPWIDYSTDISEQPVLLVQFTRFKCGGVSVGTAISHTLTDGQSALMFFNTWAKMTRSEEVDLFPYVDRTVFYKGDPSAKPRFEHVEFGSPPKLIGEEDDMDERKKETTVTMLKLSEKQVEQLRENANHGNSMRQYTRYESITAHVWRCVCKARKHDNEQLTRVYMVVDGRNRLRPPLPKGYFGNAIVTTATEVAESIEMWSKPLSYSARKVSEAIAVVDNEYIRSAMDFLSAQPDLGPFRSSFHSLGCTRGVFLGNPNLAITSWLGLPTFGADFGWGKPIHMGPGGLGFEGKCFVIPSGDEDGFCTVALRLKANHMADFEKFFYEDI